METWHELATGVSFFSDDYGCNWHVNVSAQEVFYRKLKKNNNPKERENWRLVVFSMLHVYATYKYVL